MGAKIDDRDVARMGIDSPPNLEPIMAFANVVVIDHVEPLIDAELLRATAAISSGRLKSEGSQIVQPEQPPRAPDLAITGL